VQEPGDGPHEAAGRPAAAKIAGHVPAFSDISNVADHLGGHYVLWGLAITAFALGLLALGLWWAWGRPERQPPAASISSSLS
jgi:hypothetical protein